MRARTYVLSAAGLAVLVLAANNVAYATTGRSIIAGIGNSSSATTGVTMTSSGAALKLTTKKGSPPLAVNSTTKVKNLNADSVDGLDSTRLLNDTYRFTVDAADTPATSFSFTLPTLPKGSYLVNYAVVPYATGGTDPTVAAPLEVQCWVDTTGGEVASSMGLQINSYYGGQTGAAPVTLGTKEHVEFMCQSDAGGSFGITTLRLAFTQTHIVKTKKLFANL
jgi:hypothetical protein